MGKTRTKNPTTIATVVIAALLVISAAGMGIRQLLREGVFRETQPLVQNRPAEPQAPLVKQAAPEPKAEEPDTRMWAEQQPEQEPVEPEPPKEESPTPPQQTRPEPAQQPVQMVNSTHNLSREQQDQLNYEYIRAVWPSLSPQDREEAQRVMERWPTMSEEERDYYRSLVQNLQ